MSLQTCIFNYMRILISTKHACLPRCRGTLGINTGTMEAAVCMAPWSLMKKAADRSSWLWVCRKRNPMAEEAEDSTSFCLDHRAVRDATWLIQTSPTPAEPCPEPSDARRRRPSRPCRARPRELGTRPTRTTVWVLLSSPAGLGSTPRSERRGLGAFGCLGRHRAALLLPSSSPVSPLCSVTHNRVSTTYLKTKQKILLKPVITDKSIPTQPALSPLKF